MVFTKHFEEFFDEFFKAYSDVNYENLNKLCELILLKKLNKNRVLIFGNGGSAAIASHFSTDLIRAVKVKGINFNEASLITCFANDFGYEEWVSETIKGFAEPKDLVILISSSGNSLNMVNAAHECNSRNLELVTFSGFSKSNKLRKLGNLNFWVDSNNYNVVENAHQTWLLAAIEGLVARSL